MQIQSEFFRYIKVDKQSIDEQNILDHFAALF